MTEDEIKSSLSKLVQELYTAKQQEEVAKKARIAAEEAIAALVETGDNGSRTVDAGVMKVTVKRSLSYAIDDEEAFANAWPTMVRTTVKRELDWKVYEAARERDPRLFREMSEHVTVRPKKVSVSLKV